MDNDLFEIETSVITAAACFVKLLADNKKIKRRRRTHPYLQQRHMKGRFVKDFQELGLYPEKFRENYRMDKHVFDHLLSLVEPYLSPKKKSRPHDAITPEEKLAVVLEKKEPLKEGQMVLNYRLSRARRCVENAFGILCSKFYCLARTMFCGPDRAQKIIAACCYLHNFLLRENREVYCPFQYTDSYDDTGVLVEGEWRKKIPEGSLFTFKLQMPHGRTSNVAKNYRDILKEYVNSPEGFIPWQRKAIYLE